MNTGRFSTDRLNDSAYIYGDRSQLLGLDRNFRSR
jgi:hypothetical protein